MHFSTRRSPRSDDAVFQRVGGMCVLSVVVFAFISGGGWFSFLFFSFAFAFTVAVAFLLLPWRVTHTLALWPLPLSHIHARTDTHSALTPVYSRTVLCCALLFWG